MKQSNLQQHVPQDVALGSLLALLFITAFVVVIPRLKMMQELPMQYYNELPVSDSFDFDRDGIPNNRDARPFDSVNAASGFDAESASGDELTELDLFDSELELLLSDEELEAELDFLLKTDLEQ